MSDNVALSWNRAGLEAVRQTRMGPPIVARALHMLHASMYDAWAAHRALADLFPTKATTQRADAAGRPRPLAAAAHPRRDRAALPGPHWGLVVPFALRAGWQLRPRPPRRHPSRAYLVQAEQLLADSAGLTDEHKAIAEYWADGPGSETPPGHWCLHAQEVSARDGHGLDEDARLFFALTGALLDAGIACWDAKRTYDSVRPITAIRFLFAGREVLAWAGPGLGTRRIRGEDWQPYLATPPFLEYFSGHSTFSAAAAAVLARFTGSDRFGASVTIPAGSSRIEPGTTPAADVVLCPGRPSPTPPSRPAAPGATAASTSATATWSARPWGRWSGPGPGRSPWTCSVAVTTGATRPPDRRLRAGGRRAGRGRRPPGRAPAPTGTWSAWP
jgi:hypothetical protein